MSEEKPLEDLLSEKDDLTLFRDEIHQLMIIMSDRVESRLQEIEKSFEEIEKQIATLIVGYGEQAVFMEALIAQINFASPEAQKAFTDNVSENRKKMFHLMKEGASGILGPENKDLASAVENVAGQKLSDSK